MCTLFLSSSFNLYVPFFRALLCLNIGGATATFHNCDFVPLSSKLSRNLFFFPPSVAIVGLSSQFFHHLAFNPYM